jgi:hypothetical protein
MGILLGKPNEVDEIQLSEFKSGKFVQVNAITYDDYVYFTDGSKIYVARQIDCKEWAFPLCFRSWPWQRGLFQAAQKLGLIDKSAVNREIARLEAKALEENKKYALEDYEKAKRRCLELGLETKEPRNE